MRRLHVQSTSGSAVSSRKRLSLPKLVMVPAVLSLMTFTGCLVDQPPPKNNGNPVMPPLEGKILMMDNLGVGAGGEFLATFSRAGTAKQAVTAHYAALMSLGEAPPAKERGAASEEVAAGVDAARGDGDCQLFEQSPSRDAQAQLVSVGKLDIGHSQQDAFVSVPDNGKHQYYLGLPPGFEADSYIVIAEGAADIPKFGEVVAVPPALTSVHLNGSDFFTSGTHIKKSQNLKLQWDAPIFPNSAVAVAIQLVQGGAGGRQVVLQCSAGEDGLPMTHGTATWEITPSQLAQFPAAANVQLIALRANLQQDKAPLSIKLEGMRLMTTVVTVDP